MNKDTEYPIVDIERLKAKGVDAPAAYVMLHLRKKCNNAPYIFAYRALYPKGIKFIVKDLQQCKSIADIERLREEYLSIVYTIAGSYFRKALFSDVYFDYSKPADGIRFDIKRNKRNNNLAIFKRHISAIFGGDFFKLLFEEDLNQLTYLLDIKNQQKRFNDLYSFGIDYYQKNISKTEKDLSNTLNMKKEDLISFFWKYYGNKFNTQNATFDDILTFSTFEDRKSIAINKNNLEILMRSKFIPTDPWTLLDYADISESPAFKGGILKDKTPPFVSQLESFEQRLLTLDF